MGHKSGCRHVVDGTEATKVPGHSAQCQIHKAHAPYTVLLWGSVLSPLSVCSVFPVNNFLSYPKGSFILKVLI